MYRLVQISCLAIIASVLSSCGTHRLATRQLFPQIDRPTWSAVETSPDHFVVLAKDSTGEQEAFKELCQKHKFVCHGPEAGGRIVVIERRRK
jgi:hypothetical protein